MRKASVITDHVGSNLLVGSLSRILADEVTRIVQVLFDKHCLRDELLYHLSLDAASSPPSAVKSKYLRGNLCLLFAESCGVKTESALPIACAIELYHNASLVFDDIQDQSPKRRGRQALWAKCGAAKAINVAFLLKTAADVSLLDNEKRGRYRAACLELMAASIDMTEGQTRDLESQAHWHEGLRFYYETARLKSGRLFASACELGATDVVGATDLEVIRKFGANLGIAYQIYDDLQDLFSTERLRLVQLDSGNVIHFLLHEMHLPPGTSEEDWQVIIRNPRVIGELVTICEQQWQRVYAALDSIGAISSVGREKLHIWSEQMKEECTMGLQL